MQFHNPYLTRKWTCKKGIKKIVRVIECSSCRGIRQLELLQISENSSSYQRFSFLFYSIWKLNKIYCTSLKKCSNVTLCHFSSNVSVNRNWECIKLLLNIFIAKTEGHVVMQHLQCLPNITNFGVNWIQQSIVIIIFLVISIISIRCIHYLFYQLFIC